MGTRGLISIRKHGVDKAKYIHYDSYPDGVGKEFVELINRHGVSGMNKFFDNITLIDSDTPPTISQIEHCKKNGWFDNTVSTRREEDWYCLLRGLQDISEISKAIDNDAEIFFEKDGIDFIKNSLFCEYAYIFDIDDERLEFYVGFQTKPQPKNLYGTTPHKEYYPCRLTLTFPVAALKDEKNVVEIMQKVAEAETERIEEELIEKEQEKIDSKYEKTVENTTTENITIIEKNLENNEEIWYKNSDGEEEKVTKDDEEYYILSKLSEYEKLGSIERIKKIMEERKNKETEIDIEF